MEPKTIEDKIKAHIDCDYIHVHSDDLRHYAAIIVSPIFEGQNKIKRHRHIHQALGSVMGNEIHAMSIQAMTPDEYQQTQS
ncbi:BolA family protein [Marinicella gelatinilytica]|uniref:BolA family protein n=1 Tax=Marinicella gelatinilytica TaxID=2996017 RepID=UPI0022610174|nr:BolA family protein [Marinicella gelatinilytica]MCX7544604.1 BolA family transcriptional regulator [Marinicella gelatinilytica]